MSPELFALLERLHGHTAVLGLAVLLHPVITLGRRGLTRGGRWSLALAMALISVPSAAGWWLYPTYRRHIKPVLVVERVELALAFETKEHLAFSCLVLTLAGGGIALRWGRDPRARRVARALLGVAWLCGVGAGVLGMYVAGGAAPAW